jgi:8-oxo-dGTP pyrophosphatase MutT (NUDIX family)
MKQHGPWKIKSSEVKYKNPWIEVRQDEVIRPDGGDGMFGTVKVKNGASVLALDADGYVYLVKQFQYGFGIETIEVVSGGMDGIENSIVAAKRELEEEVGIIAGEWIDLGMAMALPTYTHHEQRLYLARDITHVKAHHDDTETIILEKVEFDEAVRMVMDGRIIDAYSCVLILKAAKYLGKLV